ncbi:hypothetical protein KO500_01515 [Cellulophaga baltica]|uniref:SIMPL domain-containing protein n=1 Tax=Cellulophaga TaxID=104264 RepID=UPI001C0719CD|nr:MULTISPECIES: SIMPL domain-containing protein [Cellulophaga]MBU2995087.1 hypothetical protein [Cellulophaga baltica]MDO6766482.1 hypothetical protein [Cellulophaga sp. 1_MG-2023]
MKKLAFNLIILLMTMTGIAQTTPNSISVYGSYEYQIKPEYKARMIISMNNVYYDAPGMAFPEIKKSYLDNLTKAGIQINSITDDALGYATLGYEKEGTIIEYKTKDLNNLKKFLETKGLGVTKSDATIETTFTDEELANYAKLAYDNAKKKAENIAKKIDRKIGNAIFISDTNGNILTESLYYNSSDTNRTYQITVSFELL